MTTAANITFKWTFPQLECYPEKDGLKNVVKSVHWRYLGSDGEGHDVERYGTVDLGDADPKNFADFDALNEEVVASWIAPKVNVEALNKSMTEQIEVLRNPPTVLLTLPQKDPQ